MIQFKQGLAALLVLSAVNASNAAETFARDGISGPGRGGPPPGGGQAPSPGRGGGAPLPTPAPAPAPTPGRGGDAHRGDWGHDDRRGDDHRGDWGHDDRRGDDHRGDWGHDDRRWDDHRNDWGHRPPPPPPPHYRPGPPPPPYYRPGPPPPPYYRPAPPTPPPYYGYEVDVPLYLNQSYSGIYEVDLFNQMSLYRYNGYRVVSVTVSGASAYGQGQAELYIDGISQGLLILPTFTTSQTLLPYRLEYINSTMGSMRLSLRGNTTVNSIVVHLVR